MGHKCIEEYCNRRITGLEFDTLFGWHAETSDDCYDIIFSERECINSLCVELSTYKMWLS